MKCAACSTEAPTEAVFCPRCGERLGGTTATRPQPPVVRRRQADSGSPDGGLFDQSTSGRRGGVDDPEVEIWQGSFSPKSMLGAWVGAGALSVLAMGLGIAVARDGRTWAAIVLATLGVWLAVALLLVYRRLSIHYRLTSQRLFHESGLLRRQIDRIEVIDMDDISFEQGLFERLLGVGTIRIKSSDRTDPDLWMRGIDQVRDVAAKIDAARRREKVRRSVRIDHV